ncbi:hypothetical protein G6F40_015181 [Rhizopus arrhizus]|nr:hypothetical protein G6F40_015181 [Rhizopus arrhizus]
MALPWLDKRQREQLGQRENVPDALLSMIAAELAQAKANGTYSFGQEDYPPPVASTQSESRAQVEQELQQAQVQGQMASDQEDYPPAAMAHSGMSDIH